MAINQPGTGKWRVISLARIHVVRRAIRYYWRRDALPLLFYALATGVMTYPLITKLGNRWLPSTGDVFVKIWDIWWFPYVIRGLDSPLHTQFLFYPNGLDQTFHSISWPAAGLAWVLAPFAGGLVTAYKLTILVALLAAAYAGYLLLNYLLADRAAAWVGGAVYSFAPYHIAHSVAHPDLAHTAPIALTILLFLIAVQKRQRWAAIGAAFMVGVTAITSLYLLNFLMLTLLFLFVILAIQEGRYRQGWFWRLCLLFGVIAVALALIRVGPILANTEGFGEVVDAKYGAALEHADLLAFFVPSPRHTLFRSLVAPLASNFTMSRTFPPYLGIVPLLLAFAAVSWREKVCEIWPWLLMFLLFFVISLGPVLHIGGQPYPAVPMPFRLDKWLPPLRTTAPNFFHIGLLLPWAFLSAAGFLRLKRRLRNGRTHATMLLVMLAAVLLFEYWQGEYPLFNQWWPDPFYTEFAADYEGQAVVELPMGRQQSKLWLFYQTVHGVPLIEGLSGRTPSAAYDYINGNLLLSAWQEEQELDCGLLSENSVAIDQLVRDGIYYVFIHRSPENGWAERYFAYSPVYETPGLLVYDLRQWQLPPFCGGVLQKNVPFATGKPSAASRFFPVRS